MHMLMKHITHKCTVGALDKRLMRCITVNVKDGVTAAGFYFNFLGIAWTVLHRFGNMWVLKQRWNCSSLSPPCVIKHSALQDIIGWLYQHHQVDVIRVVKASRSQAEVCELEIQVFMMWCCLRTSGTHPARCIYRDQLCDRYNI